VYFALVDVRITIATTVNSIDNYAAVAAWQVDNRRLVLDLLNMLSQCVAAKLSATLAADKIRRSDCALSFAAWAGE